MRALVTLISCSLIVGAQAPQRWMFNKQIFTSDSTANGNNFGAQVVVADFNRDGRLDLGLIPDGADNDITVFLGNADGTFSLKQTITDGLSLALPKGLVVGDFNNDGKPDLAVASENNVAVLTYLGNGDGTFTFAASTNSQNLASPAWMVAGDFNGDGKLDVAVGDITGGADDVSILLGNGDGTFTFKSNFVITNAATSAAVVDFNHDGKPDIVVTSPLNNTVSVYLGNGDGTFTLKSTPGTGSNPSFVAAADLNGDGIPDLAVTNEGNASVSILLGAGDGTFTLKSSPATGNTPITLTIADLNGDGKPDLAVIGAQLDDVTILIGAGDGTFTAGPGQPVYPGFGARSIATGDFNRDGKVDLVVANSIDYTNQTGAATSHTFAVFIGNGDGSFLTANTIPLAVESEPIAIIAADFNGDGKLDLAVANKIGPPTPNVQSFLGNGDGTFTMAGTTNLVEGAGGFASAMVAADFNNDGKIDLAATTDATPGTLNILLGNGDGTFSLFTTLAAGNNPQGVTAGDFNGDGHVDLAVTNFNDGTISVYLGNGDGTFTLSQSRSAGSSPAGIAVGDFNGDGRLDLAVANETNTAGTCTVSVLPGNGKGSFGAPVAYTTNALPVAVAVADLNKDGKLDLIVADNVASPGFVSVLIGNGNGTFQTRSDWAVPSFPLGVVTGDFNGDGNLDVAVSSNGNDQVSILPGNGDGTFGLREDYAVNGFGGFDTVALAAGDFNNDGGLDVAVTDISCCVANNIDILLNRTVAALSASSVSFTQQAVGTTSAGRNVKLYNPSGAPLHIAGITLGGASAADFAETNTCSAPLAPGANCTITGTFSPSEALTRTAALLIADDAASSPQSVRLTGVGVAPEAALSRSDLTFSTQLVGTSSAAKILTLSNTGNASLTIASIAATGDFTQTNNCGASVAAGKSCNITVTFTPTAKGGRTGTLTVTDNDEVTTQTVSLKGTGTVVELVPAGLNFGSVTVGTTSSSMSSTLTNTAATTLSGISISITGANPGDFTQTNTCGTSVPGKKTCTITVTFTPAATGARSASVSISDNGGGSPQTVSLAGTGM